MLEVRNKKNTSDNKALFDSEEIKEWWKNPKDIRNVVFDSLSEYVRQRISPDNGKKALDIRYLKK